MGEVIQFPFNERASLRGKLLELRNQVIVEMSSTFDPEKWEELANRFAELTKEIGCVELNVHVSRGNIWGGYYHDRNKPIVIKNELEFKYYKLKDGTPEE